MNRTIPSPRRIPILFYAFPVSAPVEEKRHASRAAFAHHGFGIVLRGSIVRHFDLHHRGAGVLRQHALQIGPQTPGAIVGEDHHRPERPIGSVRHRRNRHAERMIHHDSSLAFIRRHSRITP